MNPVVLFDGRCGMCDAMVRFLIKHDPGKRFRFAAIESPVGQTLLQSHGVDPKLDSVVLIQDDNAYIKSTAVIKIAMELGEFGWLTGLAALVPTGVRDDLYDLVARHRHQIFKRNESCSLPTQDDRDRFLV